MDYKAVYPSASIDGDEIEKEFHLSEHCAIAFITDVEGNYDYFRAAVEAQPLLKFRSDGWSLDFAEDDSAFVFGGDVGDHGNGTLRVVRTLLDFKKRYPERVTLILGNRDLNKIRLTSELDPDELDFSRLKDIPGPYWVTEDKRVSPLKFLTKVCASKHDCEESQVTDSMLREFNTLAMRVKWILKETMGSPKDFENRRSELSILNRKDISTISDDEVARSFYDSVIQGGCMREYIIHGQIAEIIGSTLFVHGGLIGNFPSLRRKEVQDSDCLGYVPGRGANVRVMNVYQWKTELNGWLKECLKEWERAPVWTTRYQRRGGHALIDYVVPTCEPSVVMGRHLDVHGMPQPMKPSLVDVLARGGIKLVCIGHSPHGNSPTIIRQKTTSGETCLVVMADTSYSDMSSRDNRGVACSSITIQGTSVSVSGQIENGLPIGYKVSATCTSPEYDPLVGQLAMNGEYVIKSKSAVEDVYNLAKFEGFKVTYKTATKADILNDVAFTKVCVSSTIGSIHDTCGPLTNAHVNVLQAKLLLDVFATADGNCDGSIAVDELIRVFQISVEAQKVWSMFTDIPLDESSLRALHQEISNGGVLTFAQLLSALETRKKPHLSRPKSAPKTPNLVEEEINVEESPSTVLESAKKNIDAFIANARKAANDARNARGKRAVTHLTSTAHKNIQELKNFTKYLLETIDELDGNDFEHQEASSGSISGKALFDAEAELSGLLDKEFRVYMTMERAGSPPKRQTNYPVK